MNPDVYILTSLDGLDLSIHSVYATWEKAMAAQKKMAKADQGSDGLKTWSVSGAWAVN